MLLKLISLCVLITNGGQALLTNTEVLAVNQDPASDPHLDLGRAPYALYGVKYIGVVSLW